MSAVRTAMCPARQSLRPTAPHGAAVRCLGQVYATVRTCSRLFAAPPAAHLILRSIAGSGTGQPNNAVLAQHRPARRRPVARVVCLGTDHARATAAWRTG